MHFGRSRSELNLNPIYRVFVFLVEERRQTTMIGSRENSEKRQARGPCHGRRGREKGGKFDLSRDKIYLQRETDVQRFFLSAPCVPPTVHVVFLKVAPG